MTDYGKIGLCGGDQRMLPAAAVLCEKGECAVWGLGGRFDRIPAERRERLTRCADWESAVRGADTVVLPLPTSRDGKTLNCPLAENGESAVKLFDIVENMKPGAMLCGGMLPGLVKKAAAERGITVVDYYDCDELQIRNAVATAEGAIAACIGTLPVTIAGMKTVVCGYGRVGRTLACRLIALGATVYAAARSAKDQAWAEADGCHPIPLSDYRADPVTAAAIFNTIPSRIFDGELLGRLKGKPILFELASSNAGVDPDAAEKAGVTVVSLPSLPGKTAPETAGEAIGRTVARLLDERAERNGR